MPEKLQNLESLAFPTQVDREVLRIWFDQHNNIKPIFVERNRISGSKSYNLKQEEGDTYTLQIAKDIQNKELISIIFRINQITFGDEIPEYASSEELGRKIILVIHTLLKRKNLSKEERKEVIKYTKLYKQLFGNTRTLEIGNEKYREKIINQNSYERFEKYKEKIKILESTSNLLETLSEEISNEIGKHFDEAIFEDGVEKFDMIMTTTKDEVRKLLDKRKAGEIKEDALNIKDFYVRNFDKQEKLLRQEIGMDTLILELNQTRKEGSKRSIEKKEIKIADTILKHIYKYPWQSTNSYGASPKYIRENKEIHCVGYSLIGHKFLQELGIEHYSLTLPGHSALEVIVGGKNYYFDATVYRNTYPFEYGVQMGVYKEIILLNNDRREFRNLRAISGDPETTLQSHILHNLGARFVREGKIEEAILMVKKAVALNPQSASTQNNLGDLLRAQGVILRQEGEETKAKIYENEALQVYQATLPLDPSISGLHNNLGTLFAKRGNFDKAITMYKKALKINKKPSKVHNNLGKVLEDQGKYNKAEDSYKDAIIGEPEVPDYYENLGNLLIKNGLNKSGDLVLFAHIVMTTEGNVSGTFPEKESKIIKLIQKKGFWRLRRFLFSQIKKEKKTQAKEKKHS